MYLCPSFQTTLAHIIASGSKKRGTARFVSLSATSTSTNEVREVIKQAQNELKLMKRKTILFIDEIHRFNKSQQVITTKVLQPIRRIGLMFQPIVMTTGKGYHSKIQIPMMTFIFMKMCRSNFTHHLSYHIFHNE